MESLKNLMDPYIRENLLKDYLHGDGIQRDNSGVVYSGSWVQGERDGFGTLDFGDGSSYTGEFKNGYAVKGLYDWGNGEITILIRMRTVSGLTENSYFR